jgi:hypothetical protein
VDAALHLCCYAQDPGGANMMIPCLQALQDPLQRLKLSVSVFAGPLARARFEAWGAAVIPDSPGDWVTVLDTLRPDALLTGTSVPHGPEQAWWRWAAAHGTPAVALVDQPLNIAARFQSLASDALPRWIALPDVTSLNVALAEGLPAERLTVVGPLWYQFLAARTASGPDAMAGEVSPVGYLLALEPLAQQQGHDDVVAAEGRVVSALLRAVSHQGAVEGQVLTLAVRCHPKHTRQQRRTLAAAVGDTDYGRVVWDESPSPEAALAAHPAGSWVLLGWRSSLLIEGLLQGYEVGVLSGAHTSVFWQAHQGWWQQIVPLSGWAEWLNLEHGVLLRRTTQQPIGAEGATLGERLLALLRG